jgi:hypothetical protein
MSRVAAACSDDDATRDQEPLRGRRCRGRRARMIPTRCDLSLDAHTIEIAATAGLSSLPACALRLDLASQYLCLAGDARVAAFLEELGRRRHGISFQPNHLVFQTLAEAAIESIAEARIFLGLLRSWTPRENINKFLPVLDLMMTSGLVTLEKVQVLQYGTQMTPEPVRA